MNGRIVSALLLAASLLPLRPATLEQLSLNDLIVKSTAIVRGKIVGAQAAFSGRVIYTHYQVQVSEQLKSGSPATVDLAVPGGTVGGIRQIFAGTPQFQPGDEYVFFLWTGKNGLTQVTGLTQGLFQVTSGGADPPLARAASHELMLDAKTHHPVRDQAINLTLSALRGQVAAALGKKP